MAIVFIANVFLARVLGANEYGIFMYAFSWLNILGMISQAGFKNSLIRLLPEYQAKKMFSHINGLIRFSVAFVSITSVCIGLFFISYIWFTSSELIINKYLSLVIMITCLPVFSLNFVTSSILRAIHQVSLSIIPNLIVRPAILLFGGCMFYWSNNQHILSWHTWLINLLAFLLTFIFFIISYQYSKPNEYKPRHRNYEVKKWLVISMPMVISNTMTSIINRSSVIILDIYVAPDIVGIFGVCTRIATLIAFALTATNLVIGPFISKLFYSQDHAELQKLLAISAKGVFGITLFVLIGIILFGANILGIFGQEYTAGYYTLLILIAGQFINSLAGAANLILNITGFQNHLMGILIFSAVTQIGLSFVFCNLWGINGAALAATLTILIWNLLMLSVVFKKTNLNPTIFSSFSFKSKPL